jgi:hypothetical protein
MSKVGNIDLPLFFFHQEVLCRTLLIMNHVTSMGVKLVNTMQERSLNHRQFIQLLQDLHYEHTDVSYHSSVQWLSLYTVLKRKWEEILMFLNMKDKCPTTEGQKLEN